MKILSSSFFHRSLLPFFVLVLNFLHAQKDPYIDFNRAREKAFEKNYEYALTVLDSLTVAYPNNEDFVLFKASVLHWSGQREQAGEILKPFLATDPPNKQALQIQLQILEADTAWGQSAELCLLARKVDPSLDTFYLFHQALALYQLERNEEALLVLDTLRNKVYEVRNEDLRTAILKKQKNIVTLGLGATTFPNSSNSSWYFSHLQYRRAFRKSAAVFRLNYGNVNQLSSSQIEGDYYWNNSKYSYIYLNYGYSPDTNFFSKHRVGAEYFYERKSILLSLGARNLWFSSAADVFIATASVGYQYKKLLLDYRIFLVEDNTGFVPNHYVYLRHQNDTFERYFQLDFQYGKIPFYYSIAQDFDRRDAYRFGVQAQLRAGDNFFFKPIVAFEIENLTDDVQRERIYFQLNFSKRF
ncbi:MAG: YaiO family outer membrane beta-barrel protein [Crocinitomicaceae bacterium]|jgi:YaiO family outer membrane protein|nr:YaiO family outer membrane beta-barrel protein [Crocinitomicaceae bacterium]